AYLPCVPDDEMVIDGIRQAFVAYTKATGKADPLLKKALDDKDPSRRALAVQVFGEALPSEHAVVRAKLDDPDAKVRYLAGSTLAKSGDLKAMRSLLRMVSDGPIEYAFQVEDLLCQLLDSEEKPPATLSGDDKAQRDKARTAWEKWLADKGDKVKLTRLTEA